MGARVSGLLQWWRLLRPVNLVLIALTPAALWAVLSTRILAEPLLHMRQVVLLGLAVALVAGAGNVVNDIADRTIDALNERRNVLNEGFPVAGAWSVYVLLHVGAGLLTWQLAGELDMWRYAVLLPVVALLLLLYAFTLKCQPVLGNVLVAALCAGVPALVFLAEPALWQQLGDSAAAQSLGAYVTFAFFGTWARELAKDVQDLDGDRRAGCATLAVRWPTRRVLALVWACLFATAASVAFLAGLWYRAGGLAMCFSWSALWLLLASVIANVGTDFTAEAATSLSKHLKLALGFGLLILVFIGNAP